MRFNILAIIAIWLAMVSSGTLAALINENDCYGDMDCYLDTMSTWQSGFVADMQAGYGPMTQSLALVPDTVMPVPDRKSKRHRESWLDTTDTAFDSAMDNSRDQQRLEFDPEVLSFITDFDNSDFGNPGRRNYAQFNYRKTSGFKQIRLSHEDLDHVRNIVDSSSRPRGSSDFLAESSTIVKRPPAEPIEFNPFSLQMIIIFHIVLFVIAFIVFKLDRA
ncbi:MAG: hypothetical protein R3208_19080 [Ketobacteraceae bacterium]|nr:hypothetical protein [Ketobacteraceae bacterium]